MKFLANGFFCRLVRLIVAGEVIPHTGRDEQVSRLREFWLVFARAVLDHGDTLQRHIEPALAVPTLSAWRKLS